MNSRNSTNSFVEILVRKDKVIGSVDNRDVCLGYETIGIEKVNSLN